jgi:putative CocE/NonD family hydrolase
MRAGGSLSFEEPSDGEAPDGYAYDPADPVAETVGTNCWGLATAIGDRRTLDGRADILRYTGEPLSEPLELMGPVGARLHAASSAVDTDFTVTLCDVFPDGTVNTIQDGIVRARYRNGLDRPSLIEPGRVHEYVISLCATSYVLPSGHRLRVDVSSSNFDRYDRNPHGGAVRHRGRDRRRRTAHPPRRRAPVARRAAGTSTCVRSAPHRGGRHCTARATRSRPATTLPLRQGSPCSRRVAMRWTPGAAPGSASAFCTRTR